MLNSTQLSSAPSPPPPSKVLKSSSTSSTLLKVIYLFNTNFPPPLIQHQLKVHRPGPFPTRTVMNVLGPGTALNVHYTMGCKGEMNKLFFQNHLLSLSP